MAQKLRNLILLLLLLSWCGVAEATDYTQDANCVGAWLCDEGSGESVNDETANNRDGAFKQAGEPAWDSGTPPPGGYVTNYVHFDGSDDYIEIIDANDFSVVTTDLLSVVCWANPDTTNSLDHYISKGGIGFGQYEWALSVKSGGNTQAQLWTLTGDNYLDVATSGGVAAENWRHIAFTIDDTGGSEVLTPYINGVSDNTDTTTGGAIANGTGTVRLGGRGDGGNDADGFGCEYAIFNDILDSTEINEIMDNGLEGAAAGVIKTYNGLAWASVKTINGLAVGSIKTINSAAAQ